MDNWVHLYAGGLGFVLVVFILGCLVWGHLFGPPGGRR